MLKARRYDELVREVIKLDEKRQAHLLDALQREDLASPSMNEPVHEPGAGTEANRDARRR